MALTPFFFGGDQSIFDPLDRFFEPSADRFPLWDNAPFRRFAQDVSAIASTRVDWVETPEAHIFKADLPGDSLFLILAYISRLCAHNFE
ncbi:hypothetical protein O6H91_10G096200 [Diphasiastrum complanatum]|uniref:Uncharacterized protein n=1 Tax=Diphasiastrum complanatum TaxID=34168 RepID=A0ACC2CJM7_DIPCM|nr:hypothetical protein O6H91_10G096200 [Diphasiastrum complanatum]